MVTLVSLPHTTHSVVRLRLTLVGGEWVELVLVIWFDVMEVVEVDGVLDMDAFGGVVFAWRVAAVDGASEESEVDDGDMFDKEELEVMSASEVRLPDTEALSRESEPAESPFRVGSAAGNFAVSDVPAPPALVGLEIGRLKFGESPAEVGMVFIPSLLAAAYKSCMALMTPA